jgi:hypothetical protein
MVMMIAADGFAQQRQAKKIFSYLRFKITAAQPAAGWPLVELLYLCTVYLFNYRGGAVGHWMAE